MAKGDNYLHPVRPHETIRLPLEKFSFNLILEYFSKICRENSSVIKFGHEKRVFCIKTNINFLFIFPDFS